MILCMTLQELQGDVPAFDDRAYDSELWFALKQF